jgi:hypothetical protein
MRYHLPNSGYTPNLVALCLYPDPKFYGPFICCCVFQGRIDVHGSNLEAATSRSAPSSVFSHDNNWTRNKSGPLHKWGIMHQRPIPPHISSAPRAAEANGYHVKKAQYATYFCNYMTVKRHPDAASTFPSFSSSPSPFTSGQKKNERKIDKSGT